MAAMDNKKSPGKPKDGDAAKTQPIRSKQEIEKNPDNHIDQDFSGYPHAPASKELINPKTKEEKKSAAVNIKDGEKLNRKEELDSDGSANAFDATETVSDDE